MAMRNENLVDDAAFEVLFKKYFTPLCAYCQYKFDFELDTAKEAVHRAFIRLWENRHLISQDLSVQGYLYKTVTNISLDMLRHKKVKKKHREFVLENTSTITAYDGSEQLDIKQLASDIDKAVREL